MRMNREQFIKTFTNLRKKTLLGQKQANRGRLIPDARKISANEDDFLAANEEICKELFK